MKLACNATKQMQTVLVGYLSVLSVAASHIYCIAACGLQHSKLQTSHVRSLASVLRRVGKFVAVKLSQLHVMLV